MPQPISPNYAAVVKAGRQTSIDSSRSTPSGQQPNKRSRTTTPRPGIKRVESSSNREDNLKKSMYLAFVRNALREKTRGNSINFDELVGQFNPSSINKDSSHSSAELKSWVKDLSHIVSSLERVHAPLVDALIALPWATMDAAFAKCYIGFIGILVSAKPEYLGGVLARTVQGFTYHSGLRALKMNHAETSAHPMTRRTVYNRLHTLLEHLLSLIPTLSSLLQPLLIQNFPHKRQDKAAQVTYIKNLLRISEYCGGLGDRILATVIERAIQIDVEVQVELEDLEDEGLAESADILSFDPFDAEIKDEDEGQEDQDGDDLSDLSSDVESVESSDEREERRNELVYVIDMVSKLDAILKLVFDHLHSFCSPDDEASSSSSSCPIGQDAPSTSVLSGVRRSQFLTLLTIFDRTILKTFKSRYTQFLVFWYSSLDMEFSDLFQGLLVSKALFEDDQPSVIRAASASYIASYVSRAQFVDQDGARRVIALLCDFLERELGALSELSDNGVSVVDARTFTVFYAVAQAVFLIFCFRWRDFTNEDEHYGGADDMDGMNKNSSKKWIPQLDVIQRVIMSPLNPLKVCSQNVVRQFARISQATGFVYCYGIIESNRRSEFSLSTPPVTPAKNVFSKATFGPIRLQNSKATITVSFNGGVDVDLNTFFPFDPYRLPSSMSYIAKVYREWSSVALDDEDEEEDEPEEDEDEGNDDPSMMVVGSTDDELGQSFGGMSISPARPMMQASAAA